MNREQTFDLKGRVGVITGGGGVLCRTLAAALAREGARLAILDINAKAAGEVVSEICAGGGTAMAVEANVLQRASLEKAAEQILQGFGQVDFLLNGAGGNKKEATTSDSLEFFDLPEEAIRWVVDLNLTGTILPSQVFGRHLIQSDRGSIINISSMAAIRPLTRTLAYSCAKAAVSNFTQWLAVHVSQNYSPRVRVNAVAPGFFLTEQNRYLLLKEEGELSERGKTIIRHTPMARFGCPEELIGVILWLLSPGASFVHGAVIPIDGGFSAFSGV